MKESVQVLYSFVQHKISKEYLKCDIKPWKILRSFEENISLEPLNSEFLSQNSSPRVRVLSRGSVKCACIFGYRELCMKREFAEYLRDVKASSENLMKPSFLALPYWKLARGGGAKEKKTEGKEKVEGKPEDKEKSEVKEKPEGKEKSEGKEKQADSKSKGKNDSAKKPTTKSGGKPGEDGKKPGGGKPDAASKTPPSALRKKRNMKKRPKVCFCFNRRRTKKRKGKEIVVKDPATILREQKTKKWKWPNKRKRYPLPPSPKFIVLLHRLYRLPKDNGERGTEWLYLSDTDPDEDVIQTFDKGLHNWMIEGISFESQKLLRHLQLFLTTLNLTGRSFLHHRPNFAHGHIEYSARKRNMLPFVLTSVMMWTILCIFTCSVMDITEAHLRDSNIFVYEKKYWLPFVAIVGNLLLVSFWSLAVLLGDGQMISHHLNCWSAALHEMETSGALDVRSITCSNLRFFFLYAGVYSTMFVFNWPEMVRGSCGLTANLLLRPGIAFVHISQPPTLLFYQWIGFGVQLYILYCARMVMTMLQIFALMLKNVSEMWNFKFALTYKLLAVENRGTLYQLQLNHSLAKLWSHHRLITVLLEQYGLCLIFAIALAKLVLFNVNTRKEYYKDEPNILVYSDAEPTIEIPYYHEPIEELFMAVLVLVHIGYDFISTSESLAAATNAVTENKLLKKSTEYMTGGDFVRRAGMMTSAKSHERKLIFSLQWSFAPVRLHAITANRFIVMNRYTLYKAMSFIFIVFSIIIRIQTPDAPFTVVFPPPGSCSPALGQTLVQVTMNPATPMPPAPPAAKYYFLREHCQEIELEHTSKVSTFEYYTDGTRTAETPPFQICNVTVADGTSLPQPLADFGRYFEDHGSNSIKRTIDYYLDRTYDPSTIDYKSIVIATTGFHPDTTEGGYCGPDSPGQPQKRCEWVEYYRDCMIACFSPKLNKKFLIPMLLKKDPTTNAFSLYNDYKSIDCGVNPFAIRKGNNPTYAGYDCFGREMTSSLFDSCGNLPFFETRPTYTPAQGYPHQYFWTYTSSWEEPEKTFTAVNVPGVSTDCPTKCYDSEIGRERCSNQDIVKEHCALSSYWGPIKPGHFYAQKCYELTIDAVSRTFPTGFCRTDVTQGAVEDGDAILDVTYNGARPSHWDRTFDLSVEDVPCKDYATMELIIQRLYFQHVCIFPTRPISSDPCQPPPAFFPSYRPYELVCHRQLSQIKFNYEVDNGNSQLCDFSQNKMKLPLGTSVQYTVGGVTKPFELFYGCHGKPLYPEDPKHNCLYPVLNGVCEVNSDLYLLLYGDCIHTGVIATGYLIGSIADFGLCRGFINIEHPLFENYARKLISDELLEELRAPWGVDPWTTSISIRDSSGTTSCSEDLNVHYCGAQSVALHYHYDEYDSRKSDRFLCNWEAYYRDCLQPYRSTFGTEVDWLYLPKWVARQKLMQSGVQRKSDPVLNSFAVHPAADLVSCDGRSFPTVTNPSPDASPIDDYWLDDCGWVITPEFVDGDPQSLAIMAPILPIALDPVYDADGGITTKIIHCYDSEVSLFRCLHPEVFPICKRRLSVWEPTLGAINYCYKFNKPCFAELNKQPIGGNAPFLHPPGFCRGYCPHADTLEEGTIGEPLMEIWRDIENMEFSHPPCLGIPTTTPQIFLDFSDPRLIELQLFLQLHCNDPSLQQLVRDPSGPISGSFHWPFYKTSKGKLKLIPRQVIRSHLETTFGSACNYGGMANEGNVYPASVTFMEGTTSITVAREDFFGCHGLRLIWFTDYFSRYPGDLIGVTDPQKDFDKVCHGRLLAGWCEAEVDVFYLLREDFLVTCNDCPSQCISLQANLASHFLNKLIVDDPNWNFFVKTNRKVLRQNFPNVKNLPNRILSQAEYDVVTSSWKKYKDHLMHTTYLNDYRKRLAGPDTEHCHHPDPTEFEHYCTFFRYMEQCYVPCELVYPDKFVTTVSQSIVKGRSGTVGGRKEVYLQPLVYYQRGPDKIEPSFSFVDCVIDPTHIKRESFGCNLLQITDFDSFGFGKLPEFRPDTGSTLPVMQHILGYPSSIDFEYELLTEYIDPKITYGSSPPKRTVSAQAFVSSYFNCFRFTTETMRLAILSATDSYWTSTVVPQAVMSPITYLYHPEDDPASNLCHGAPIRVWLHWKACKFWNIPSRVRRTYGTCAMILPVGLYHGSYAAVEFKGEPPLGCMQRSHPQFSDKAYLTKTVEDMFADLNYYCSSCGYTKKNHQNNIQGQWCGHHFAKNDDCLEREEFTYRYNKQAMYTQVQLPTSTAQKTIRMASDFATLWLSWHQYACWKEEFQEWVHYLRPYHYNCYGIQKSQSSSSSDTCQRLVPIPVNSYGCPFPCKNDDESEDCNSNCKYADYNLCDHPLRTRQSDGTIAHWQFALENGVLCKMDLKKFTEKTQGLGIFNALGTNTVECEESGRRSCPTPLTQSRRDGPHLYNATSHFYELGVFRSSDEHPQLIYERGSIRKERIDLTDGGDGPRPLVLHSVYIDSGYRIFEQYSNLCAALDNAACTVNIKWSNEVVEMGVFDDTGIRVYDYLGPSTVISSACPTDVTELIERLLGSQSNLGSSFFVPREPWKLSLMTMTDRYFCCLPAEEIRFMKIQPDPWPRWRKHYKADAHDSFSDACRDIVNKDKSEFGFPVYWDKNARYPGGAVIDDCEQNKCKFDPKTVANSDFCNRQFDPNESFADLPFCTLA
ncbi:Transcription elongation factor A protein-like 6 [Orchesella cincta]|uniref:Transcription elongation factor A protein-like 6 n=1 Tax=Orchesella cincta TaxID=48709 RepID=A0A1D2N692_ORCCI|nr:Transcription elongation factor A protein-like 6 [Orchesella cincta]